jgi:hypothetical protein
MTTETLQKCRYESCCAPLCPLSTNLAKCIWYPGEPICRRRPAPPWVRKQYKVARKAKDPNFYFTVEDLMAMKAVRRPIGRNPDKRQDTRRGKTPMVEKPTQTIGGVEKQRVEQGKQPVLPGMVF